MAIEKIHRGIYRITVPFDTTGTVFLYALRGDRIALVDTGVADSPKTVLQQALSEIDLSLAEVSAVLNTHAHLDHIGGNLQAKRASNARIHVHEKWESLQALQAHLQAPHMREYRERVKDFVASVTLQVLEPR